MEIIVPVARKFGLSEKNVFANEFVFGRDGEITGFDERNMLSRENGKAEMLKSLNLKGDIYVIGDGYTDYQLRGQGLVTKFFAFTENVEREIITQKADYVVPTFDEFLYINKLTRHGPIVYSICFICINNTAFKKIEIGL